MTGRTTPDNITTLAPNQVVVFPSNLAGRHGAGFAKVCVKWGARYGIGMGPCGQTYALPTKDKQIGTLSLAHIRVQVILFLDYADCNPQTEFLVSKIGCGLANYTPEEIAPLFIAAVHIPNVHLPAEFWAALSKKK